MVGIAWIGFDQPKTLGTNETGSLAALPIWIAYMQKALKGVAEKLPETPPNVVSVRINPESGLRDDSSSLSEWFYAEFTPRARESEPFAPSASITPGAPARDARDQLF